MGGVSRVVQGSGLSERMQAFFEQERAKKAALCGKVMEAIDAYIKRYDVRGIDRLKASASDVCDGWVTREEIDGLVRGRRLKLFGKAQEPHEVCGSPFSNYWSVELSEKEIQGRYADRLEVRKPPARVRKSAR